MLLEKKNTLLRERDIWKVNLPISQTSTISLAFEPPPPTAAWISIPSVVGYGYFQEVQKQLRISLFCICWKVWIVFKDFSNIIHHVDPLLYLPSWLPVLILFYLNEMRFLESYWKNCNHLERYMYVLQWGLHVGGRGVRRGGRYCIFRSTLHRKHFTDAFTKVNSFFPFILRIEPFS